MSGARLIHTIEAIEDQGEMLRINADAVVLDSEDDVSRLCPAFGFDGAIFWRIFDGIVYEILQDLSEKIFFCKQLRRCRPYDLVGLSMM